MADEKVPTPLQLAQGDRAIKAMQLYRMGWSFREIGGHLGVSTQAAHGLVHSELMEQARMRKVVAKRAFELDLQRLDDLLKVLYPRALKGDDGAVDRVIRVIERRARMFGYDKGSEKEIGEGTLAALLARSLSKAAAEAGPPVIDVTPEGGDKPEGVL